MMAQIKALTRLELLDLYGLNRFLHTKDKKAQRKSAAMAALWGVLIALMAFYTGGLAYGLILLGAGELIPAYLITIASLLIFCFDLFKAGGVIFRQKGYDVLTSLPVNRSAIVISRFSRLYVEDLAVTLVVLLPGLGVYGCLLRPGIGFWSCAILTVLSVPLLPMAAAALIGALITGISSRMKHKSLAASGLSVLAVLLLLLFSAQLSSFEGAVTPELLKELSATVLSVLRKLYPPAVWLGEAMVSEHFLSTLGSFAVMLGAFSAVAAGISLCFDAICRKLFVSSARHDYRLSTLNSHAPLYALWKRELQRYFASSIYVSNTIIGPLLGTALSVAVLLVGLDTLESALPVSIPLQALIPFGLAGIFCLMTTTCTSISMEGSQWWITKSLPLETKTILDAKLLMNLSLTLPFYLVSELFLVIALTPSPLELVWLILIPAVLILFACVFGLAVNLRFPSFDWESEVTVVKQSTSSLLGGLGGFLVALLAAALTVLVPEQYLDLLRLVFCLLLAAITVLLYRKIIATDLQAL